MGSLRHPHREQQELAVFYGGANAGGTQEKAGGRTQTHFANLLAGKRLVAVPAWRKKQRPSHLNQQHKNAGRLTFNAKRQSAPGEPWNGEVHSKRNRNASRVWGKDQLDFQHSKSPHVQAAAPHGRTQ